MNNPLLDTPAEVTEKLLRWGGKNEYGNPCWRIILAENHLVQRAGVWTEYAEGTDTVQFESREHDVAYKTREIAPDAVRVGMFWVPLYPCRGWILERWFPPSAFGSKIQWESALSQDNETPMMGPFPEEGGYFLLSGGGPWEEIPPLECVRAAMAEWENKEHSHGEIDEEAVARAMQRDTLEAEEREQEQYDAFLKEVTYMRLSHLGFLKGNPALSGFRNRLSADSGLMSHI
jgi:hypothetical protein